MAKDLVLLLTGTVDANNMAFTKLLDPDLRRSQYIDALRFWLKKVDFPVVFVENSGNDLSEYFPEDIKAGRIEMYCFDGNNYDRRRGKGYGEMLCIEHAYEQSELIRNTDFVFKVTGRHKVLNFNTFIEQFQKEIDVQLLVNFYGFLKHCDSKIFGFVPGFIPDYLLKQKDSLNDTEFIYFENALCVAALQAISEEYNFRPLAEIARIDGSSGTLGIKYRSDYVYWLRSKLEAFGKYNAFK